MGWYSSCPSEPKGGDDERDPLDPCGAGIKLVSAPAVVLEKEDDDSTSATFAFRTGFARGLEVNHVPLAPTIYVDLVDAEEGLRVHLVYGVTIEIPF